MAFNLAGLLGEGLGASFKKIVGSFKLDPALKAQFQAAIEGHSFEIQKLESEYDAKLLDHETTLIKEVNATMREEAKSEHWLQWSWRPIVGYTFSAVIINNYILLPYFATKGLQAIVIPGEVWSAMLVILGVAAGTRGWEKITRNGK